MRQVLSGARFSGRSSPSGTNLARGTTFDEHGTDLAFISTRSDDRLHDVHSMTKFQLILSRRQRRLMSETPTGHLTIWRLLLTNYRPFSRWNSAARRCILQVNEMISFIQTRLPAQR